MRELTRDYICTNSPRFTEKLDAGCYNDIIFPILCIIFVLVCLTFIIYYIGKIVDLLKTK